MYLIQILFIILISGVSFLMGFSINNTYVDNGWRANRNYPWLARILLDYSQETGPWESCEGSLIASNWILTARHCGIYNLELKSENIMVSIGGNHDFRNGEFIRVSEYLLYPQIDARYNTGVNIALLKLEHPPKGYNPIRVQYIDRSYDGEAVTVYGWEGERVGKNLSDNLRVLRLKVVTSDTNGFCDGDNLCIDLDANNQFSFILNNGGPMTMEINGVETLIGIAHTSQRVHLHKNGISQKFYYSVYIKLSYQPYANWIENTIRK